MKVNIEYTKKGKDKVKVKVESRDLWSGDVTLARVIYPFLKKYRKLYNIKNPMCGYPMEFSSDPLEPEGPDNSDKFDEWLLCLDKMVYAFGWIAKHGDWDGPWTKEYYKQYDELLKPYRKELKKLAREDARLFKELGPNGARESLEWKKII